MSIPATGMKSIKDVVPSMAEIEAFEAANREEARLIRDLKRTRQRMDGGGPVKAEEPAFADAPATAAELAELRRRLEESDRVAAAYRRQARSSILTNWQHEHIEAGRAQCNAAADRVLDQIRDEAIAGGDPLCPECRRRPVGTSQGLCSRCDEAQGSGPRPE